jgi:hypothetical protein
MRAFVDADKFAECLLHEFRTFTYEAQKNFCILLLRTEAVYCTSRFPIAYATQIKFKRTCTEKNSPSAQHTDIDIAAGHTVPPELGAQLTRSNARCTNEACFEKYDPRMLLRMFAGCGHGAYAMFQRESREEMGMKCLGTGCEASR